MFAGGGLEGPGDEDLRRVIDEMDAFAATAAAAADANDDENKPTNITPI
jgi:hypothetical protein